MYISTPKKTRQQTSMNAVQCGGRIGTPKIGIDLVGLSERERVGAQQITVASIDRIASQTLGSVGSGPIMELFCAELSRF